MKLKVVKVDFMVGVNVIGQPIVHTHTIYYSEIVKPVPADLRSKQLKQTWNVD
jgi:hypothetical protein